MDSSLGLDAQPLYQPAVLLDLATDVICELRARAAARLDAELRFEGGARAVLDGYQDLPSYRAMLDREGAEGPADVAIVRASPGCH